MSEFERFISDLPAWVTTSDGSLVRRAEYEDLLVQGVLDAYDPIRKLVDDIKADKRKSFGKSTLLDMLAEYR